MNVRELIAKLQQCPPDALIATGEPEAEGRAEVLEIVGETPIVVIHSHLMHGKWVNPADPDPTDWWERSVGQAREAQGRQAAGMPPIYVVPPG